MGNYPQNIGNAIVIIGIIYVFVLCAIFNVDIPWYSFLLLLIVFLGSVFTWGIQEEKIKNKVNDANFRLIESQIDKNEMETQRARKDIDLKNSRIEKIERDMLKE